METQRLLLREMNPEDFEALFRVLGDPVIMQHYPYAFDEQCVRSWIERNMNRYRENGFGLWAVCLKNTGEMIGDCGLTLQNIDGKMLPEIGYQKPCLLLKMKKKKKCLWCLLLKKKNHEK